MTRKPESTEEAFVRADRRIKVLAGRVRQAFYWPPLTPNWVSAVCVTGLALAGGMAVLAFVWLAWLLAMGAEGL